MAVSRSRSSMVLRSDCAFEMFRCDWCQNPDHVAQSTVVGRYRSTFQFKVQARSSLYLNLTSLGHSYFK
jgi:hypothetical protein